MQKIKDYLKESFTSDLKAGFITAIVAVPLAIAFAMASGMEPVIGLHTAVIAGILGSLLGGSRYSITGPTGAMAVIVLSVVHNFGISGLMVAGFLSGLFLILFGILRIGEVIKFIPLPVISGFTAGIGVIIFIGQIANFFGLSISSHEYIWDTLGEVISNLSHTNPISVAIAVSTMLLLVYLPAFFRKGSPLKNIPPSLVALVLSIAAVVALSLSTPLIGQISSELPAFRMIPIDFALAMKVLPAAVTIALLGAIESLLCAVVCDGMTSTRHDSNKELLAQGAVNVVVPFFGGIPATAAIARSAVNIREGAKTRMSGVYHALFILTIMVFFSPIAQFIPKAFLAGILMIVSIRMVNVNEFRTIMKISKSETLVLFTTFGLTVLTNLVTAIQIGMLLAVFLLFVKLVKIIDITTMENYDSDKGINATVKKNKLLDRNVAIYTIHGPFFFGAMNVFERKIDEHIDMEKTIVILRMKHVPFMDSTGIERLKNFVQKRKKKKSTVLISGLHEVVKEKIMQDEELSLELSGKMFHRTSQALDFAEKMLKK